LRCNHLRAFGDPRRTLLGFEPYAAHFGEPGRIEQQDRAAVISQSRSGIESRRHDRRSGGFHHKLFVVVDPVH
jgi:hypothetical protein